MMKRIAAILAALMLLCMLLPGALAHEAVQTDRTDCSIELEMNFNGEPVSGGTLTAIQVGYVHEENGNYSFRRIGDDAVLDKISSSAAAENLLSFYESKKDTYKFSAQTVKVEKGLAKFENLKTGLYLILQEQAAPGFGKLKPFLVSVPYLQDGEYLYHVTCNCKPALEVEAETLPPTEPTKPNPEETLPQTGSMNWPIPLLMILGMCMVMFGIAGIPKKQ